MINDTVTILLYEYCEYFLFSSYNKFHNKKLLGQKVTHLYFIKVLGSDYTKIFITAFSPTIMLCPPLLLLSTRNVHALSLPV